MGGRRSCVGELGQSGLAGAIRVDEGLTRENLIQQKIHLGSQLRSVDAFKFVNLFVITDLNFRNREQVTPHAPSSHLKRTGT
jgi:hypothetical protein